MVVKGVTKVLLALTAIILLALIIGFFGIGFYLSPQSHLAKSDVIVAISGGETNSRALEAIKLYQAGWAPRIIFSGAAIDPNSPSNAQAMRQLALANHVPADAIILDETSTNTDQNATGVSQIVRRNHYHQIILVTSPYHQRRASLVFRAVLPAEISILNHSTTDHRWRRSHWWASEYSRQLTLAETQKVIYVLLIERNQLENLQ